MNLDIGDAVTITLGKETFFPEKYNGFDVGPLSATVRLRAGETLDELWLRAHRVLDVMFEAEFELKNRQWRPRLGEAGVEPKR